MRRGPNPNPKQLSPKRGGEERKREEKGKRERKRGRGEDQKRIIRISNKNPFDHTGKLN